MNRNTYHWGDVVADRVHEFGELVVGIDPVLSDIPIVFEKQSTDKLGWVRPYLEFILSAIEQRVGFVKFQSAFFEALGSHGVADLAFGISEARRRKLAVILDAKCGDIASTTAAYARAYLTPKSGGGSDLEVDCITVNPFLGPESLEPFVECARQFGKGLFILTKTSNPGAGWLQDGFIDGSRVSDHVARQVAAWAEQCMGGNGLSSIGAVVGATYPEDGERLRALMPKSVFLVPGLGAQGGGTDSIQRLRTAAATGVVVSASRGVTKIQDRNISASAYGALIEERVGSFKSALR
jgi:orotidine-5'-phosphate decarboxylase